MDNQFMKRSIESYLDSLLLIDNHATLYCDDNEIFLDEKIIEENLFIKQEIEKCKYELNLLKNISHDNRIKTTSKTNKKSLFRSNYTIRTQIEKIEKSRLSGSSGNRTCKSNINYYNRANKM